MDNFQQQIQLLKPLKAEEQRLKSAITKKSIELGGINKEIQEANYKLQNIKKQYDNDSVDLYARVSALNRFNVKATLLNKEKYFDFHKIKDLIASLSDKYERTKKDIQSYKIQEIEDIDREVLTKRVKLHKEYRRLRKNKKLVFSQLQSLHKKAFEYKKMINDTTVIQTGLKSDYTKLQNELRLLSQQKGDLKRLNESISTMYVRANVLLDEREVLLRETKKNKILIEYKLKRISSLEEKLSKNIDTQNMEIELKKKEIKEKEELLKIKQIQLDDRQQVLDSAFNELRQLQSVII